MAKHSDSLRDTLPDDSLRTIYDRQVAQIKGASGFATGVRSAGFDLPALLRKLQIALDPFDLQVHRSSYQRTGLEDILGRASIVWEYGTLQEKKDLLKDIQTLAGRVCGAAKSSIQEEWAEAKRTHKEDALLGEWKTRSLQRSTHAGSGVAEDEPRRSEARPAATAMSKNTGDRIEPDKQKVHWVEIRLVPLPDAAPRKNWWRPAQGVTYAQEPFTAEVTDGQKDSALGGGASARYDNIPGGTCSWTFTRFFDQIEKAFKPGSR